MGPTLSGVLNFTQVALGQVEGFLGLPPTQSATECELVKLLQPAFTLLYTLAYGGFTLAMLMQEAAFYRSGRTHVERVKGQDMRPGALVALSPHKTA